MVGSEVFSTEIKKTEVLMQTFVELLGIGLCKFLSRKLKKFMKEK
jgi:DNA helicase TIP49 (TBP-interacting protein)